MRYLLLIAAQVSMGCTQAVSARTRIQMPKLEISTLRYPPQLLLPGKSSPHCHAACVNKALEKVSNTCGPVNAKSRTNAPSARKLARNRIWNQRASSRAKDRLAPIRNWPLALVEYAWATMEFIADSAYCVLLLPNSACHQDLAGAALSAPLTAMPVYRPAPGIASMSLSFQPVSWARVSFSASSRLGKSSW